MQSLHASSSAARSPFVNPSCRRGAGARLHARPASAVPQSLGGASCFQCGQKLSAAWPAPARGQRRDRRAAVRVSARGSDLDVQDRVWPSWHAAARLYCCCVILAFTGSRSRGWKILGALPYVVPLLDGIRYGRYFFMEFPISAQLLAPLRPLVSVYYSVPFLSLIIFFALYSGVVNNFNLSRHVRFNAMQAVLLSVLLIFPTLIEQVLRPSGSLGLQLHINLYNTIWLFVATCVTYGVGASLLGRAARLPLIASAADQRVL